MLAKPYVMYYAACFQSWHSIDELVGYMELQKRVARRLQTALAHRAKI
jgi:hypothetical protein